MPSGVLLAALALQRARAERAAAGLRATERALLFHYRDQVHGLERVRAFAGQRISALQAGGRERFPSEVACAAQAVDAVKYDLARAVSAYMLLGFGAPAMRARFTLHPEERARMVEGVLAVGYVADERGRRIELGGLL